MGTAPPPPTAIRLTLPSSSWKTRCCPSGENAGPAAFLRFSVPCTAVAIMLDSGRRYSMPFAVSPGCARRGKGPVFFRRRRSMPARRARRWRNAWFHWRRWLQLPGGETLRGDRSRVTPRPRVPRGATAASLAPRPSRVMRPRAVPPHGFYLRAEIANRLPAALRSLFETTAQQVGNAWIQIRRQRWSSGSRISTDARTSGAVSP